VLGGTVPDSDLDTLIAEAMGHSRSHQTNPEQTYANLLLVSVSVHSTTFIISQADVTGQAP
jgi:hypothetical protein